MLRMEPIQRRVVQFTAGLLAFLIILWFFAPEQRPVIAGWMTGILTSLFNMIHLSRRLWIAAESVIATGSPKTPGIGLISRILIVVLAIAIARRFPDYVDFRTVVLGLPVCYIITIIVYFRFFHEKKEM
jgi:hypothetical protein